MGIPERLKECRAGLGLSQTALAEAVRATKRSVINWEGGAASPSADVLARYAEAGADVLYILTGVHTPEEPTPEPGELLLLANYRECSPEDKAALLKDSTLYAAHIKMTPDHHPGKVTKATVKKSLFGNAIGSISIKK